MASILDRHFKEFERKNTGGAYDQRVTMLTERGQARALDAAKIAQIQASTDIMGKDYALNRDKLDFAKLESEAQRRMQAMGIQTQREGQRQQRTEGMKDRALKNAEMTQRAELHKASLDDGKFDRVLSYAATNPDLDAQAVAEFAALSGAPQFGEMLKGRTARMIEDKLPGEISTINKLREKNPAAAEEYLNTLPVDLRRAARGALNLPGTKPGEKLTSSTIPAQYANDPMFQALAAPIAAAEARRVPAGPSLVEQDKRDQALYLARKRAGVADMYEGPGGRIPGYLR